MRSGRPSRSSARRPAAWAIAAVHRGDARVRAEPFAAIEQFDLALLWASVAPPPPRGTRASEGTAKYDYDW